MSVRECTGQRCHGAPWTGTIAAFSPCVLDTAVSGSSTSKPRISRRGRGTWWLTWALLMPCKPRGLTSQSTGRVKTAVDVGLLHHGDTCLLDGVAAPGFDGTKLPRRSFEVTSCK